MKKKKKESEDVLDQDTVSWERLREAELDDDKQEEYDDVPYYRELDFDDE